MSELYPVFIGGSWRGASAHDIFTAHLCGDVGRALMMERLRSFIETNHLRYVDELTELLKIPSISALPVHGADMRHCAEWTAAALGRSGLKNARLIETHGNPVVYAEWLVAPGKPTVLCYGHYDVQPAGPVALWDLPPFAPTVRDGKLYARGASDD